MMHSIARLSRPRVYARVAVALLSGRICQIPLEEGTLEFYVDVAQRDSNGVITVTGRTPAEALVNLTIAAGRDVEVKVLPQPLP